MNENKYISNLTLFGPLGREANEQCVPVRGVRRGLVASDRPENIMLNQWWPDMSRRQPLPVGSHSGYYMSRCLRSGRSQWVFYRDLGRSCIVLVGQVIKRPNVDSYPSGRSGITGKESQTDVMQEVGLIHSSDDALGNLGRGIFGKRGCRVASQKRTTCEGILVWSELEYWLRSISMYRGGERCKVCR
jgi:hypothetical protein